MSKYMLAVITITILIVSLGFAKWYGYVVRDDTGQPVENAAVYAYSSMGSSDWVYTDSLGYWELDTLDGMVHGRNYGYIWGEKMYGPFKYGNYISGGLYNAGINVNKGTIRITYPPPNPNPD